jgi:alpha-beta hydrolase superfamily lysophospholipase
MIRPVLLLALASIAAAQESVPQAPAPATPAAAPVEEVLRPPEPGRFKSLFLPFRTDNAALSPDGKYLAYSIRENETVSVLILDVDQPGTAKARVAVINDDQATPMMAANQREKTPARINWMRWVTPSRLVLETNQVYAHTASGPDAVWRSWHGAVIGFDADGANARQLAGPKDLQEFFADSGATGRNATGGNSAAGRNTANLASTPDMPLESPPEGDLTAADPTADVPPASPRSLKIFGLDPQHPDAVILSSVGAPRGNNLRSVGYYSLNALTGKMTEISGDLERVTEASLLDRQGRIRVTIPNSLLSSFPFHYDYLGAKGKSRAQLLTTVSGQPGFSVSPDNFFGERSIPLGFAEDPKLLYYASNVGRDTYGIYSVDTTTWKRGGVTLENPAYDLIAPPGAGFPNQDNLVFDRFKHDLVGVRYHKALRTAAWLRPEWQARQAELEKLLPGRSVEILDWDEKAQRFLVATESPADPGAYFVYEPAKGKLLEFVRRAPWIDASRAHVTLPFSYSTKDGGRVSGLVTAPRQPRMKPIPMVVLCPDLPWQRVRADFQTEVQALADMGFVVVQLNGRGAWGLGLKQRQSLTAGYDLVQVEDIATTVASLGQVFNVNPKRVALLGRGHGGFIALRALQEHPDKFRCAIAIDAPVDLADWLERQRWSSDDVQPHLTRAWLGDAARLKAAPLTTHPEQVTKPVLMLHYPGADGAPRRPGYAQARNFASRVRTDATPVVFTDLSTDYMNGLPEARAAVFDEIEAFLNEHVYEYKVKMPDIKIIKETKP